ncbi:MAG: hypothetical protein OXH54_09110 [Acidimicrobiaceae bacterium]|nr:hypothetical protein [Acidimicrobiaceae bacterium]
MTFLAGLATGLTGRAMVQEAERIDETVRSIRRKAVARAARERSEQERE